MATSKQSTAQLQRQLDTVNAQIAAHEAQQRDEAIYICTQLIAMHGLSRRELFPKRAPKK